jgi:hypothetical protein
MTLPLMAIDTEPVSLSSDTLCNAGYNCFGNPIGEIAWMRGMSA